MQSRWRIRVDTGGTFTDAWALGPDGIERRAKILSDGTLRCRLVGEENGWFITDSEIAAPDGTFAGWSCGSATVAGSREGARRLKLEGDTANLVVHGILELSCGDEAPVAAAHILTGTPAGGKLPPMDFRVATTRGTNALLERKGAPVLLVVSSGFADLLEIRDQRRELLFSLAQPQRPGLAAMTNLLLKQLPHMHVVELDRDLVARLEKAYPRERLTVHSGDALKFDFGSIPVPEGQRLRVVGNLPYNISSPLLFHLAEFAPLVEDQHFMLQKEVVERMVAEPGTKAYSRLSVMLQWRYDMELLFIVPPEAFDPPPQVDSAIVRMIPKRERLACDAGKLEQVVAKAFSQRRKVIRNCVAGMFTEAQLVEAGIDPGARPEAVGLEQYVALANLL